MTKAEIKKAIENGEKVWRVYPDVDNINNGIGIVIDVNLKKDTEIVGNSINQTAFDGYSISDYFIPIEDIFKTKSEAEHHSKWGNRIKEVRFQTPPTYEEFLEMGTYSVQKGEIRIWKTDEYIRVYKEYDVKVFNKRLSKANYDLALEEMYKLWKESL